MARRLRIGLLWHSVRSGNLGVGALSVGNIALARAAAERVGVTPSFVLIGPREPGASYIAGDDITMREVTGRYMISPGGYGHDLSAIDLLLDIGAGDSFTDIYTDRRFAYIIGTKLFALARGKPLILSPQTIGPFSRQPHKALAAWVCRRARLVVTRDPLSTAALASLSPKARTLQAIDVAFALPFDRPPPRAPGAPVRVGLNVSGLLMSGGYAGGNEYGLTLDYPAFTHRLIEALLAMPGVQIDLVPHVIAPGYPADDDAAAADRLVAQYPALRRGPDFASPSAAKSFIAGLDFLVGARMHATIAAYSAGVPVVPVSYSRKFEGLFGGLGYPWLVPSRGMATDAALAYVLDAFARRDAVAADIARGQAIVADGLERYTAALATEFDRVAQG